MTDTDKYERMLKDETYRLDGRNNMMALKLLEEVKRLREGIEQAVKLLNTDANATRELLKEMIE